MDEEANRRAGIVIFRLDFDKMEINGVLQRDKYAYYTYRATGCRGSW